MSDRTELHLTSRDHMVVYLNGRLMAECVVGHVQDRDSLEGEVRKARASRRLVQYVKWLPDEIRKAGRVVDHINATPAARHQAFSRGLLDGLDRKTVEHPEPGIPPMRPEHTRSYEAGYTIGEAIARAVAIATEGEREAPEGLE